MSASFLSNYNMMTIYQMGFSLSFVKEDLLAVNDIKPFPQPFCSLVGRDIVADFHTLNIVNIHILTAWFRFGNMVGIVCLTE